MLSDTITLKDGTRLVLIGVRQGTGVTMAVLRPLDPASPSSPGEQGTSIAALDASQLLPDGGWYLNRIVVYDLSLRGKGLGAEVLERLKRYVSREGETPYIIVEPGGYDSKPERLVAWYVRQGFVPAEGQFQGAMVWRPAA